jgi:hypothetical protein
MSTKELREQFMRIATARLKSDYPFLPQRIAVAASMYRRWYERQLNNQ